ncbi:MAG: protein translocase subunit SecF [Thermodesulfobacteriota bacterium]
MEFIKPGINLNFVGRRRLAYAFSGLLILLSVASLLVRGGPNYGVDFAGGLLVQVNFQKPITSQEIRDALSQLGLAAATIQKSEPVIPEQEEHVFLIRVPMESQDLEALSKRITDALGQKFGRGSFEVDRVEMVGPKVGKELRQKALFAIFYAMMFILIYISGRFELKWLMSIAVAGSLMAAAWAASLAGAGVTFLIVVALVVALLLCFVFQLKYALGAVLALIHDVTITVGIFSVLDKEITLSIVAALLTIVGYSLNDTIIVFDRIRENLRKNRRREFGLLINESINETLSRTVLTSGTTLLVVVALYVLGGAVISDFALAMLVGIGVGTYSSIFVASPVLLIWPPEGTRRPARTR